MTLVSAGDNAFSTSFVTTTQSQNITYTLPPDDGDANYVLASDGNGVLSWQSVSGVGAGTIQAVGNVITGTAFTGSDSGTEKGNELIFEGSTVTDDANDIIVTAVNPATSLTYTLPDLGTDGTFAFLEGTQTFTGSKIFNGGATVSSGQTFAANGTTTFAPNSTNDITFTTDVDSTITITGLQTAAGNKVCLDSSDNLVLCDTQGGTLQLAYDAGNTIDTTDARDIAFTLSDTASDASFTLTNEGTANAFIINDTNAATNLALAIQSGSSNTLTITENGTLSTSGNIATTGSGTITSAGLLTVSSGGASITGGLNNNAGGITDTGAISGATDITASGTIQGDILNATTAFQLNGTNINTSGTLSNVAYLDQANVFSAGQTISAGGLRLTGGIDNNTGGITEAGAISGATTISSGAITTTDILTFNGAATDITTGTDEDLTLSPDGAGEIILSKTIQLLSLPNVTGNPITALCRDSIT
ncbi:MAG: beta strand repeat-containing protein, partial [Acidobacteriota bacterium]